MSRTICCFVAGAVLFAAQLQPAFAQQNPAASASASDRDEVAKLRAEVEKLKARIQTLETSLEKLQAEKKNPAQGRGRGGVQADQIRKLLEKFGGAGGAGNLDPDMLKKLIELNGNLDLKKLIELQQQLQNPNGRKRGDANPKGNGGDRRKPEGKPEEKKPEDKGQPKLPPGATSVEAAASFMSLRPTAFFAQYRLEVSCRKRIDTPIAA